MPMSASTRRSRIRMASMWVRFYRIARMQSALTLAGDAGKGWLAVWLAQLYAPEAAALAGLAVFLGHLFPLFHRFKGGKGVATAAGVLSGLDLWLGLGSLATWIVIAVFFRYASLASLVAALFAPFFAWYIVSSSQRGLTPKACAAPSCPWRRRRAAAKAIMAPLSVHKSGCG